jgi:hypothetical protein
MLKTEEHGGKIRQYPLFAIGLGTLFLLISNVFILKYFREKDLNEEISRYADGVKTMFYAELATETELLQTSLNFLLRDSSLQQVWIQKDREAILERSLPIYQQVLVKQDITHFYYMGTDRVCFLRVHQPDRHGDLIDRITMTQAFQRGQTAWGAELGPLGTFVLRMVSPWNIDGKIQGYLELGKGIYPIAERVKQTLNVELFFVINKAYLKRSDWESGLAMLGRKEEWNRFPNFVLLSSTLKTLPADVYDYISEMDECESQEHLASLFNVSWGGNTYKGKPIALYDAAGKDIGDILVLAKAHSPQATIYQLFNIFVGVYGVLLILLLVLFYFYFKRIRHELNAVEADLARETEDRQNTKA